MAGLPSIHQIAPVAIVGIWLLIPLVGVMSIASSVLSVWVKLRKRGSGATTTTVTVNDYSHHQILVVAPGVTPGAAGDGQRVVMNGRLMAGDRRVALPAPKSRGR